MPGTFQIQQTPQMIAPQTQPQQQLIHMQAQAAVQQQQQPTAAMAHLPSKTLATRNTVVFFSTTLYSCVSQRKQLLNCNFWMTKYGISHNFLSFFFSQEYPPIAGEFCETKLQHFLKVYR